MTTPRQRNAWQGSSPTGSAPSTAGKSRTPGRGRDWLLLTLLAVGLVLAIRNLALAWPVTGVYDWNAAGVNFVAQAFTVPFPYLLARETVRWLRRSRRATT